MRRIFLTTCVVFSGRLRHKLVQRFRFSLQNHHVNLLHIESRPSKQNKQDYAFFVSCDNTKGGLKDAIEELKAKVKDLRVLSRDAQFMDNNDDAGARASKRRVVLTYVPGSQWLSLGLTLSSEYLYLALRVLLVALIYFLIRASENT